MKVDPDALLKLADWMHKQADALTSQLSSLEGVTLKTGDPDTFPDGKWFKTVGELRITQLHDNLSAQRDLLNAYADDLITASKKATSAEELNGLSADDLKKLIDDVDKNLPGSASTPPLPAPPDPNTPDTAPAPAPDPFA